MPQEEKNLTTRLLSNFLHNQINKYSQNESNKDSDLYYKVTYIVIKGNCVTESPQLFNLTRTALKGDARRVFEIKATELHKETPKEYTLCVQAVMEHVFLKNALRRQRFFLRRNVHLTRNFISEFFARFVQINEYLTQFSPFDGEEHKLSEEEIIEILYSIIPKAWKSKLMDHGFDPVEHSLTEFSEQLVRFETFDAINGNTTINQSDTKHTGESQDNKKRKASEDTVPQEKKPEAKKAESFLPASWALPAFHECLRNCQTTHPTHEGAV